MRWQLRSLAVGVDFDGAWQPPAGPTEPVLDAIRSDAAATGRWVALVTGTSRRHDPTMGGGAERDQLPDTIASITGMLDAAVCHT